MKKIVLKIDGMTCSACSSGLEKYLKKQKGIQNVQVNLVLSIATIEYQNIKIKEIEKYIKDSGFKSLGEFRGIEENHSKKSDKIKFILLGIYLLLLMYISMGPMFSLKEIPLFNYKNRFILETLLLFSSLFFIGYGYDILKSGFKNLIHKMPNMDTLVMCSVSFSFFSSLINYFSSNHTGLYFESICMVIYFVKLGRFIEEFSKHKTTGAIQKLVQITPQNAILKSNDEEITVSIDEIKEKDILICKPGLKIAVDGIVCKGKTYVDESFITGESVPILKELGSKVIAGSINYDGYIEYEAKKIGRQSTISEIVKLMVEATNLKSNIGRLADKISGYFVPIILVISIFTFLIQSLLGVEKAFLHMVTIFVVACPCALGLAVPLVVVVSNGMCAKSGLFLRNGETLENARNIDTIVFDKTGTLTVGQLQIFKTYNYSKYTNTKLLNIVSNLEQNSTHPIHTAFHVDRKLDVSDFQLLNGLGISGKIDKLKYYVGNLSLLTKLCIQNQYEKDYKYLINHGCSILFVVEETEIIGLIGVRDVIRGDIKNTIKKFYKNKIDVVMLTGDNEITANIIAKEIGIETVFSNVLPKMKAEYIKKYIAQGKKVMMVGDGINDAPALVCSTVGVSINGGTDIAMDSADVILMNNDIKNILDLIKISKNSYRIIKQNLFWAFFYNLCMIPIAMGLFEKIGISMTPMLASIAMTFSSITVVFNSLRLERVKDEKHKI